MSLAKLTMMGMNTFLNQMYDQTLFDLMQLPEGIDKEVLCDNIMLQGGEFEVLYADPAFMRNAIGMWSKKCYNTFLKWITAQSLEYNPLENYDRMEDWTDQLNRGASSSARRDSGNTRTFNNQDKRTLDTENKRTLDTEEERTLDTTITAEDEVSAFDSSTYQPSAKNTTDNDGTDTTTHTGTDTMNNTGTDTVDYSGTIKDEYGEGSSGQEKENAKNEHTGRVHGNIGVLTSQKMLSDEYEVARFNIIDQITDMFILEFCVPVYE